MREISGPLLVLAGAGAGKTRVITYRIAHLITNCNVPAHNILALTFTNKAASEMKNRLMQLAGSVARKVWMGTFHSVGLNILRRFGDRTCAGDNFSVIDQDDRIRIVRDIVKTLNIDSKKYSVKNYLSLISEYKNTILYVENREPEEYSYRFSEIFDMYEKTLRAQNLIDFDDMLSLTLRLFLTDKDALSYYKSQCRYILVDEYQDTNVIQFMFLQALAGDDGNICVVGDDDQAIYCWRGAQVENILYFDNHFKNVKEVKLVENYRSAPEILEIANNIIRKNSSRRGKELTAFSQRQGEVKVLRAVDEVNEARAVAEMISDQLSNGVSHSEIAVLYRTNAQSRNFEVCLNQMKIPYRVVGGVGFYQRREIKDILSYLRFYDNPYDEQSFIRAAKTPSKGIGDTLIDKVKRYSSDNNVDLLTALNALIPTLSSRQSGSLGIMSNIMHNLAVYKKISEMINYIVDVTNYKGYLVATEDKAEAEARITNLEELYNAALSFEEQFEAGTLSDFLATATLITSSDEAFTDTVNLMSLHASKGLEFESVFLTGLEEGIFPLCNQEGTDDIEEERRLCYVGITRAKVYLTLTSAMSRMVRGQRLSMSASRFFKELENPKTVQAEQDLEVYEKGTLKKGQLVNHQVFGNGVVMQVSGTGETAKVDVIFKKHGIKKLIAKFLTTA